MIFDLHTAQGSEFPGADVCVIGAGAAGIILSTELVRQGYRVLLLEGGGRELEICSQDIYQTDVVGLPHRGTQTGRFRMYGGTTTQWGGQILELDEIDFAPRPWIKGSGWPFRKQELKPFYQRALQSVGLAETEEEDDARLWHRLGLEVPELGPELVPYFTRWTPEPNFTRVHRETLEKSNRLAVYLHANAVQFVFDEGGQRVTGVRCLTLTESQKEVVFTAERFVLCLGGIESTRFLLQPQNPAPWNGHPLLGKHFQDHIDANAAAIDPLDRRRFHMLFDNVYLGGRKFHPKFKLSANVLEKEKLLNVAAMATFSSESDETMIGVKTTARHLLHGRLDRLKLGDVKHAVASLPQLPRHAWRYRVAKRAYNPADAQIHLRVHCEQEPLGESRISLSQQRDKLGLFRSTLDWKISDRELHTIARYTAIVSKAFGDLGLATVRPDRELLENPASFRSKCDDTNHHMGGIRMAENAEAGVVDPTLRLHGTSNAYVCSSAVFPTSGFSNPTHTLLALAMRMADELGVRLSRLPASVSAA